MTKNEGRELVTFFMSTLGHGGQEGRLLQLVEDGARRIDLCIILTGQDRLLWNRFAHAGVRMEQIEIKRPYCEIWNLMRLAKYVKANRVKIINVFTIKDLLCALFIKMICPRIQIFFHWVTTEKGYEGVWGGVFRKVMLKYVDCCVSNSNSGKTYIEQNTSYRGNVKHINNGVDTNVYSENKNAGLATRRELGLDEDAIVIGTVANFRPEKDYEFLIRAIVSFLASNWSARLLCVGAGPDYDKIKTLAQTLGVSERVFFTGYRPNVADYLNAMDVFVLCSKYEGQPNCILQAMSVGVPVVASNIVGISEVVQSGRTGLLYEPGDQRAFVSNVKMLLEDEQLRKKCVENGKIAIGEKFNMERMALEYNCLFLRTLEKNRAY